MQTLADRGEGSQLFSFHIKEKQTAKLLSDFHTIFDLEGNAKFIKGQDNQAIFCDFSNPQIVPA